MREIHTEVEIAAPAERVWQILTDFARFPEWIPFIRQASGALWVGARLEVRLQPPGGRATTLRPTVRKVEPNREFRWLGHVLVPGLFDGEHIFTIEQLSEGWVRFIQREEFRGLLAPLILRLIGMDTRRGFEAMNRALKARAESRA